MSYLKARPLTAGLEADPDLELMFDVPTPLPTRLEAGQARVDVRPQNAEMVDSVSADQRNGPPKGQNCGTTSRIADGNP